MKLYLGWQLFADLMVLLSFSTSSPLTNRRTFLGVFAWNCMESLVSSHGVSKTLEHWLQEKNPRHLILWVWFLYGEKHTKALHKIWHTIYFTKCEFHQKCCGRGVLFQNLWHRSLLGAKTKLTHFLHYGWLVRRFSWLFWKPGQFFECAFDRWCVG